MRAALLDESIHISEKVIRRLMAEESLVVKVTRCRKYSSYGGEITPAVANLLERDFKADKPNEKLVTDITEFTIQAGKVYLSPLIDCFDGQIISWSIGTSPNAELVSTVLKTVAESMTNGEKPIIHSDRGAHYRWPVWIGLMGEYGFTRSNVQESLYTG
jgi:transposase InsO family protein